MTTMQRNKVLIKNGSAIIEKGRNIFAEIAEVSKKSNGTAEFPSVFNVDVRTPVDAQFIGKFHLRNIKKVAGTKEMPAEGRTQFAVAGIGFCDTHEKQTSLSLGYKNTNERIVRGRGGVYHIFP